MKLLHNTERTQFVVVAEGTKFYLAAPGECMESQTGWWIWVNGSLLEAGRGFKSKAEAEEFITKQLG